MKEMIKRVREEKGGFTLAELLIVVAIILVLVAIAIPVFMNAIDEAQTATAQADIRAVQATAATKALLDKESIPTEGGLFYTATVDRHGNVTDISKEGDKVTEEDEVKKWLKGSGPTLRIVVEIKDATK